MANVLKAADLIAMCDSGHPMPEWRARDTGRKSRPTRILKLKHSVQKDGRTVYSISAHSKCNLQAFIILNAPGSDERLAMFEIIS
jgi:hypothetical protein